MGTVCLDPTKAACGWQVPKVSGLGFWSSAPAECCVGKFEGRKV